MKVLLIDVNCKGSSTGQIVYNLYSYLNERGDEAAVCYGRGKPIAEKNIYKFGLDWETYLHALLTRVTGYTGCFSFFSTRRLLRFIDAFQPDVVHLHELHAYFLNTDTLLQYLAKKNIRVVYTLHCEFAYTGKCGYSMECDRWKENCGNCPHLRDYPSTLFFDCTRQMLAGKRRALLAFKDIAYVAPSRWLLDRAKQSFLAGQEFHLIHNGIDLSVFSPCDSGELRRKHSIPADRKIALALAPHLMSETKGGLYVLQLAARMPSVLFILIGADEEPYERENVLSLGPIYDKDLLAQYYSLADCFVICSTNENFPTTCIEAVCCGTPVVGFDTGGTKEVAPEPLGRFVPKGDLDALQLETERLLTGERTVPEQAFADIRRHYSFSRMGKEYREIYTGRS